MVADVATAVVKASKKKTVAKPKKPAVHPAYIEMIQKGIADLKERGGSSRQALLKYIVANYKVGDNQVAINARVKTALKSGVKSGSLKQLKGTGASGSFRLGEVKKAAKPQKETVAKPKKTVKSPKKVKKPTAAKTSKSTTPKKSKTVVKKPAKPKKVAKSPKKTTAAKPKKAKTPKKKTATKAKKA
jgi:histone H1/5